MNFPKHEQTASIYFILLVLYSDFALVRASAILVQARSKKVDVVKSKSKTSQTFLSISTNSEIGIFLWAIFSYTVLVFKG